MKTWKWILVAVGVSAVIIGGSMLNTAIYEWSDNRQRMKASAESVTQETAMRDIGDAASASDENIAGEEENSGDRVVTPQEIFSPEEIILGADFKTVKQKYKDLKEAASGDSSDKSVGKTVFEITAPKRGWEKGTYRFFRDRLYEINIDYADFPDYGALDSVINKLCASRVVSRSGLYGKSFTCTWNYKAETYIRLFWYGLGSIIEVSYFDLDVENRIDSVKFQTKYPQRVFSSPKHSLRTGYDKAAWGTSVENIKRLYSTSADSILTEGTDANTSNGFKTLSQKLETEKCGFDETEFIPIRTFDFYQDKLYKVYINEEDCYESYSGYYDPNVYPTMPASKR